MTENVQAPTEMVCVTVYDHPTDYPDQFVARKFFGAAPTKEAFADADLEKVREWARTRFPFEPTKLSRFESDDPVIMETWF